MSVVTIFSGAIGLSVFFTVSTFDHMHTAKYPWTASLSGQNEVPLVESDSDGTADFKLAENGTVGYRVNVSGIFNASAAHIHQGKTGENGDIVAGLLYTPTNKDKETAYGMIFRGNITETGLEGPLQGKSIQDLVTAMDAVQIYVNVHTSGHPDGEIRGQIINEEKTQVNTN